MYNYRMKFMRFFCFFILVCFLDNCGYHLVGTARTIPKDIRSVCIPDFENNTVKFQAEQFVSNAIREEFIQRTKLILWPNRSKSDSVIEGIINTFKVTPISYSDSGEGNLYEIQVQISLKFINNLTKEIIFQKDNLSFTDTYRIDSGDALGLENMAVLRISKKFASEIVTAIFSGID